MAEEVIIQISPDSLVPVSAGTDRTVRDQQCWHRNRTR